MTLTQSRRVFAEAVLIMQMIVLPLSTLELGQRQLFPLATLLNLAFAAAMFRESWQTLSRWARQTGPRLLVMVLLLLLLVWQRVSGPVWDVPRFWWYLSLPPLAAGLVGWFRTRGEPGLRLLARAKLPMLVVGVVLVCGPSLVAQLAGQDPPRFGPAPMFRHVRSLNYEMPWAFVLATLLLAHGHRIERILMLPVLMLFGYFSVWSGPRGQMLSMAVFVAVLVAARAVPWRSRSVRLAIIATVAGAIVAGVVGEGDRLLAMLGRSTMDAGAGPSSGRDSIWASVLLVVMRDLWTCLAGLGPDAYVMRGINVDTYSSLGILTIQPHGTLMLWWLELGLIGLAALLLGTLGLLRSARAALRPTAALDSVNLCAALIFGQFALALIDGVTYHAQPALFMVVLLTYVHARTAAAERDHPADPCPSR